MVDGHTKEGRQSIDLDSVFTIDEVQQLVRSLQWALMMDSHEDKLGYPQRMDVMAHREFLKGIKDKLEKALDEQKPLP